MAKEPQDIQANDPEMKALLQLLLEEKAKDAQERRNKEQEATAKRLADVQAQIDAAKEQNERGQYRRDQCDGLGGPAHQTVNPANGNKRSAWRGQVNSDGCFVPVCGKCQLVMPKIKATDEQKKEGVNLGGYIDLPIKALENWHKSGFPEGCDNPNCYVCFPVKELATA